MGYPDEKQQVEQIMGELRHLKELGVPPTPLVMTTERSAAVCRTVATRSREELGLNAVWDGRRVTFRETVG